MLYFRFTLLLIIDITFMFSSYFLLTSNKDLIMYEAINPFPPVIKIDLLANLSNLNQHLE